MNDESRLASPRPEGIAGLSIDEVELKGIIRTPRGYVAQVSSGGKSNLLREGDQLFDGDVITVSKTEAVFKQVAAGGKFREVVKTLQGS